MTEAERLAKMDYSTPLTKLYSIASYVIDTGIQDSDRRKVYQGYVDRQFDALLNKNQ